MSARFDAPDGGDIVFYDAVTVGHTPTHINDGKGNRRFLRRAHGRGLEEGV